MSIGGDELFGVRTDGVWDFCSTIAGVGEKWTGDTIPAHAVEEFTKAAMVRAAELAALSLALELEKGGAP